MATTSSGGAAHADREIVISRGISAPRELVLEAFTEVRHTDSTIGAWRVIIRRSTVVPAVPGRP
jgi:hypothetical protein